MKILLIKPAWFREGAYECCRLSRVPPLNLGILAALSIGHDVRIADADVEVIPFSSEWELVGITVATSTAIEAYRIADRFRSLGVKVVLGGVHVNFVLEEASCHADAVVMGEAERLWPKVLMDFPRLKKVYVETEPVPVDAIPVPRRDLFHPSYVTAPLQITRGCVHTCRYCYLQDVPWKQYRKRSPGLVAQEIAQIKNRFIFVVDDNLFVDRAYVTNIAELMRPFRKQWIVQAPLSLGKDEKLLAQLSSAGLSGVALGIDSASEESLKGVSKTQNYLKDAKEAVRNFHRYGIAVSGFFLYGFESDDKNVFAESIEMIRRINLDWATFFVLTPYPGTRFFNQLEKEGKLLTRDWRKYNWLQMVFTPRRMSVKEIEEGIRWAYRRLRQMRLGHFLKTMPFMLRIFLRSPKFALYLKDYLFMRPFKD